MDKLILVNKENPLEKSYVPSNLVEYKEYNGEKIDPTHKTMVVKAVLKSFKKMQKAARKEGYYLVIDSAYRSYEYQKKVLDFNLEEKGEEAYKTVALPGCSEHQSGLAIDIALLKEGIYTDDFPDDDPEVIWLKNNAYKYGFIERYPQGKEIITKMNYEHWHYRFVGKKVAKYMFIHKISTLEEYLDKEE